MNRRAAVAGVLALFAAAPANAETKHVRKVEKAAFSPYAGNSSGGLGKFKPPRATLASKQLEIAKAYGLDTLPGQ